MSECVSVCVCVCVCVSVCVCVTHPLSGSCQVEVRLVEMRRDGHTRLETRHRLGQQTTPTNYTTLTPYSNRLLITSRL